jgi:phosphatidylserine/phosphatidylglycerophosphate/cardiolipin synthase-like enzyme
MQSSQQHRALGQIQDLLGGASNPKMEAKEIDKLDFSRILVKMPQRNNKDVVSSIVAKLFEVASSKMKDDHDKEVLEGLRQYVNLVEEDLYQPKPRYLDAFFFPNMKNIDRLISYLAKATKSLKVCVFTISNDNLANALNDAKKRGVDVRIISDDECMHNVGSDIQWLAQQGVPVRTDDNPQSHMHNKFVVVDESHVITGSFNWTIQAGKSNQENLLVVDHPYYVEKYSSEFELLWKNFAKCAVKMTEEEKQHEAAKTIQTAWRGKQTGGGRK